MRRPILAAAAALILAILPAGCGGTGGATNADTPATSAGTPATTGTPATVDSVGACAEYHKVVEEYMTGNPPEKVALDKAVREGYKGTGPREAIRPAMKAYLRAWAKALRAVANRAGEPELKAAIAAQADTYDRWADQGTPPNAETEFGKSMAAALAICPPPSSTPS